MAQVTGLATTWNLPNYAGELFTADAAHTPLLSMTGGLSGGKMTSNFEFPTAVLFDYPEPEQPEISEEESAVAPVASAPLREQESNVVQIHQERISLTYARASNSGRLSGINTANAAADADEKAFLINHKLIKIARDVEHSFINGRYQKATSGSVANKTRGLLQLCEGANNIDANGEELSKAHIDELLRSMAQNGAYFDNCVMLLPARQKQLLTDIYASAFYANMTTSEHVGGMDITAIETDFGRVGLVWDRFMPLSAVLIADVAHIAPVFQAVPDKGVIFEEPLAKTGAADDVQIYTQIGLAHGPAFLHGSITNLKVS